MKEHVLLDNTPPRQTQCHCRGRNRSRTAFSSIIAINRSIYHTSYLLSTASSLGLGLCLKSPTPPRNFGPLFLSPQFQPGLPTRSPRAMSLENETLRFANPLSQHGDLPSNTHGLRIRRGPLESRFLGLFRCGRSSKQFARPSHTRLFFRGEFPLVASCCSGSSSRTRFIRCGSPTSRFRVPLDGFCARDA